jgi:hypothetical protein
LAAMRTALGAFVRALPTQLASHDGQVNDAPVLKDAGQ